MVWYSHLFQNFPVYCDLHSQRLWHKAEIDVSLELSCFFDDPADVGNLINVISSTVKIRTIHIKIKTMPQKKKCKKVKLLAECQAD